MIPNILCESDVGQEWIIIKTDSKKRKNAHKTYFLKDGINKVN